MNRRRFLAVLLAIACPCPAPTVSGSPVGPPHVTFTVATSWWYEADDRGYGFILAIVKGSGAQRRYDMALSSPVRCWGCCGVDYEARWMRQVTGHTEELVILGMDPGEPRPGSLMTVVSFDDPPQDYKVTLLDSLGYGQMIPYAPK